MLTMLLGLRKSSVTIFLYIITTIKVLNENIIKLFYLILDFLPETFVNKDTGH